VVRGARPDARLYLLVRRDGAAAWQVQSQVVFPAGRPSGTWHADAEIGDEADEGGRFEVWVAWLRESMAPGPIPAAMLARSLVAASAIVKVERRTTLPFVGVKAIANQPLFGGEEPHVYLQAPIEVVTDRLPRAAVVIAVVQPVEPHVDRLWVMPDRARSEGGVIYGHFGRPGTDRFVRFNVTVAALRREDCPEPSRSLTGDEWLRLATRAIAVSRVVRVVRWEGDLEIFDVGRRAAIPGRTLLADAQADVSGATDRPLRAGERVWLVAVPPLTGNPWVAGSTAYLRTSGRWTVNSARLRGDGRSPRVDLVAVLSTEDPRKVPEGDLRTWLDDQAARARHSVRVQTDRTP
jgi:hypothetical protein